MLQNNNPQGKQASTPHTTPERKDYLSKMAQYKAKTELFSRKKPSNDQADSSMSKYSNRSFSNSLNHNMSPSNTPRNFLSTSPKNQSILESPHLLQMNNKNISEKYKNLSSQSNNNDSIHNQNEPDSIESLQLQNKELIITLGKKDDQLLQLNQKLRKAVRHSKSHKIKKEIAEQELEKIKNDYSQLQNENEDKEKVIFQLYSDIKSLNESNENDHNNVKRMTNLYRKMEMSLGNQIKKLQDNIARIQSDRDDSIKAMKKNIASLQSENDSLKIAITEYEATHHSLQEEKEDIKSQNNLLQEKYDKLKEKCQFSESESYNEIEELKEQNALLNARNLELTTQNESLKKQLSSPNKSQSPSSIKVEKLQEALREKDDTINKLRNEIKSLSQTTTTQPNLGNGEIENENVNNYPRNSNLSDLVREIRSLKETNQKLNSDLQNQKKMFDIENGKLKEQLQSLNGVSAMNDSLAYQLYELQNENSRMRENLEHMNTTTFQSDPILHEIRARQKESEQMNQIQNLSKTNGNISNNDFDVSVLNSMTNDSLVKEILRLKSQNEALKKEIDKINTQSMFSNIDNNSNSAITKPSYIINQSDVDFLTPNKDKSNKNNSKANSKYKLNNQGNDENSDDDEKNYSYSTFDEDSILHTIKKQQKESSSENARANLDNNGDQIKNDSNIASYIEDDSMIKIIQENEELKKLAEQICQSSSVSKSPRSLIDNDDQFDKNTEIKDEMEEEYMNDDNNIFDIEEKKLLDNNDLDNEEEEEEALLDENIIINEEEEEEEKENPIIKEDMLFADNNLNIISNEEEEERKSLSNRDFAIKEDNLFIDNEADNDKEEEALLENNVDYDINEEEEEQISLYGNNYDKKMQNENYFEEEEEDIMDVNDNLDVKDNKEENYSDVIDYKNENNSEDNNINYDNEEDANENEDNHFKDLNFKIEEEEDDDENNYQEREIENSNDEHKNASDDLLPSDSNNEINEEEEEEDLKEENLIFDHSSHSSSDSHSKHSQDSDGSNQNLDFFLQPNINSNPNENFNNYEAPQNSSFDKKDDSSNLNQQLAQVCSENEQLKAQNSILHEEISDLQEHLQNLVSIQLQNTLEELDDVQKGSQELRQRSYNLELLQMENSNLKHRVINLEAQNIDLRQIIIDSGAAISSNTNSSNSQMNSSNIKKSKEDQNFSNSSIIKSPKNESKSTASAVNEEIINDDDNTNSIGILKEKAEQMRSVINTIRNASSASSTADEENDLDLDNDINEGKKTNSSDSLSLLDYRTMKRENAELKEIINKFDININSGKKKDNNNSDDGYNTQLIDKVQQLELTNAELIQRIESESQIADRYEEENQGLRARITHLETQLSEAVEAEAEAREIAIAAKIAAVEASRSATNSSISFNNSVGQNNNEIKSTFNIDISPQLKNDLSLSQREEIQNAFEGFRSQISELQQSLSDIQKENSILESKMNEQMANASATESELKQESESLKIENEVLRKTIYSIQSSYSNQDEIDDDNMLKIEKELDGAEEDFEN